MNSFSDFADATGPLEGEKLKLDDVINKAIVVTGFKVSKSKYQDNGDGQYVTIQFREPDSDELQVLFTGSRVLREQCQAYCDKMPFKAVIKRINQYYTFT